MDDFFDFGLFRTFRVIYVKKSIIIPRLHLGHSCVPEALLRLRHTSLYTGPLPAVAVECSKIPKTEPSYFYVFFYRDDLKYVLD